MMEALGTIYEEQWNNITSEEADFMAQLLGNFTMPNEASISDPNFPVSSAFCPSHESNLFNIDQSTFYSSDDQTNNISFRFPALGQENRHCPPTNASHLFLVNNDNFESSGEKLSEEASYEKVIREYDSGSSMVKSKKRQRIPSEFQRSQKSMKTCAKLEDHKNNNTNMSSSYCSGDDSNASHYQNGVASISTSKGCEAMNLAKKKRACRGSATDPQSLYARKRREKINERLRILQSLVPNGTKVDISTMLEEAVQYVKFLQLQIKVLSSDDMWMYAPIAYNGMDLGLDLKISTPKPESS